MATDGQSAERRSPLGQSFRSPPNCRPDPLDDLRRGVLGAPRRILQDRGHLDRDVLPRPKKARSRAEALSSRMLERMEFAMSAVGIERCSASPSSGGWRTVSVRLLNVRDEPPLDQDGRPGFGSPWKAVAREDDLRPSERVEGGRTPLRAPSNRTGRRRSSRSDSVPLAVEGIASSSRGSARS
jgi:hypothetical protein